MTKRWQWVLGAMVAVGVVVALSIGIARFRAEFFHPQVELVMSYKELESLRLMNGMTVPSFNQALSRTALTSVVLDEDTLENLVQEGRVTLIKGSDLLNGYRIGAVNSAVVRELVERVHVMPDRFYLFAEDSQLLESISGYLSADLGEDHLQKMFRVNGLEIQATWDELKGIGLGFDVAKASAIREKNLGIMARLRNANRLYPGVVRQKIEAVSMVAGVRTVLFEGPSVVGFPSQLDLTARLLQRAGYTIGFLEIIDQAGGRELANLMPEKVVRLHSIAENELLKMTPQRALSRYVRAVTDRGIRIVFAHPFYAVPENQSVLQFNEGWWQQFRSKIEKRGFSLARIEEAPFRTYQGASVWQLSILGIGICAALLLGIGQLRSLTTWPMILILCGFSMVQSVALVFFQLEWVRFLACVLVGVMPIMAILMAELYPLQLVGWWRQLFGYLAWVLGVTLLGVVGLVALLSDASFCVGAQLPFGVKLGFLAAILGIGVLFIIGPKRLHSARYILNRFLTIPLRVWIVPVTALFALAGLILLIRTGNFGPTVPLESKGREWLEELLLIRPRTKEWLVAYPLLVMMAVDWFSPKLTRFRWVGLMGAGLVPASILNTFCHTHASLWVSMVRTFLGAVVGISLGCLLVGGARMVVRWSKQ